MRLTVLIPTWRRPRELARCLDCLDGQTRSPDEVLVVARAEDTDTWSLLEARRSRDVPGLRTLRVDAPGVVRSLSAGLGEADGDVVAITDDDAAPRPDWLERIDRCFAERPKLGGVGGRDWVHHAGSAVEGSSPTVGTVLWYGRVVGNHHLGAGAPRPVDVLKGANMAFRREALRGVRLARGLRGGGAQVHWELDLCLAVTRAGWGLVYDPAIAVDHYPAPRFDEDRREDRPLVALRNEVYNETYVLASRLPPWRAAVPLAYGLLVGTRQAPGAAVALERLARRERPGAALSACTRARIEALAASLRDAGTRALPTGDESGRGVLGGG